MKILVSGANGFVGRALVPKLVDAGYEVVPTVRRACGVQGEVLVNTDEAWSQALAGCDCVIHLAGRAHVMHEQALDPMPLYRAVNVDVTMKLAHKAVVAGVRRFVFLSTIKVNGEQTGSGQIFRAEDQPAPSDPYAISKLEAEQGLLTLAQQTGLEVVVIRPPLVYGPGVKGNFAAMIKWLCKGIPLPLGAINNERSLIALDNLIGFIQLCSDSRASPDAKGQVFLVSDKETVSTTDLLRKIAKAYGLQSRLIAVPAGALQLAAVLLGKRNAADRLLGSMRVDASKAHELLGWQPCVSMDEQLQRMANVASN